MPHPLDPPATCLAALGLTLACWAGPALALVEGVIDPNNPDSPWAGVVSITTPKGTFSGALIDPWHVLTAAHVVNAQKATPANVQVNLNVTGPLSSRITAHSIYVHPSYGTGNTASDQAFAWHDDVAVITLAQSAPPGVPAYPLLSGTPGVNGIPRDITLVAYGGYSDGVSASPLAGASPSIKRVGRNRVDLLVADDEGSGQAELFVFDLDGPTAASNVYGDPTPDNLTLGDDVEASYAGGDSGSPVFIRMGGTWYLAGIAAFNGSPAEEPGGALRFGAIGGGMLVAPYVDWIYQQTAMPLPEPRPLALWLGGLGMLGLYVTQRRRDAH